MSCCVCIKEKSPQHEQSPGIVEDDERVALVIMDPDQWRDKKFSSASFSRSRLKKGCQSVCRVKYTSLDEVDQHVVSPQIQRQPHRSLIGGAVAICQDIRSITAEDGVTRLFCVIDAPEVNGPTGDYLGHAHLGFSEPANSDGFWGNLNTRAAALAELADVFRKSGVPDQLETIFS